MEGGNDKKLMRKKKEENKERKEMVPKMKWCIVPYIVKKNRSGREAGYRERARKGWKENRETNMKSKEKMEGRNRSRSLSWIL